VSAPRHQQGDPAPLAGEGYRTYHGLELQEARRLKALEEENRRLKRLVAEQALDLSLLKDVVGRKW
jgi:putative transposase